jgi:predicted transposase/invertase (TIGR01784 family)
MDNTNLNKDTSPEIKADNINTTENRQISQHPYKNFQDLNLNDDFLFARVMDDPEVLKPVVSTILGFEIAEISIVTPQRTYESVPDAHGIRLDVYAADEQHTRYAIEIQNTKEYNLGKRSRYYHSVMDIDELSKGRKYKELKTNYVIFICTFDEFAAGRHIYTFTSRCIQQPGIDLKDARKTIILNTRGTLDDADYDLLEFLKFVENSTPEAAAASESELVHMLSKRVQEIKNNTKLEVAYMKLQDNYDYYTELGEKRGIEIGEQRGEKRGIELGRSSVAAKMKAEGLPIEIIKKTTGLDDAAI